MAKRGPEDLSESEFDARYQLKEVVNRGTFRTTYRVYDNQSGEHLYCKRLDASNMPASQLSAFVSNMMSISALQEKGYLAIDTVFVLAKRKLAYIVTPDFGDCSLAHLIHTARRQQTSFEESLVWRVLAQIAAKLYALHFPGEHGIRPGRRFIHCQLKPSNIFLSQALTVFIVDPLGVAFSSYCWANSDDDGFRYIPNEALTAATLTSKIDIYSLGCVLYELCTLFSRTFHESPVDYVTLLRETHYSSQLKDLVLAMLSPYPDARPSAQDLMHNTTIAQYLKLQFACLKLSTPTQKLLSYTNIAHDLKSMAEENEASTYNPHGIHRDSRAVSPATVHSLETRSIALASDDASSPAQDASLQQLATPSIDTVEQGVNTLLDMELHQREFSLNLSQISHSQLGIDELSNLKNYCRFLENEVAALRSDLIIAESLKHKYNDELTNTRVQLMKYIDSEAASMSPALADKHKHEHSEDVYSLKNKIKDLEIQLSMERANTFILRRENAKLMEHLRNIDVTMTTCAEQNVSPKEMVDQVRSTSIAARRVCAETV
ncbi:Kinase, NEK [Giardia duodenalis]|uniref:non-specific serine/threonine protein kinase n=1 Tax=Giardia intestinalis (strain ATCC 50803 / WB clone C6) TaxID=184922 RepID=A0A644EYZ4_GIAIC|nr:Kinase, NEK [Giardia intestinalis]KAE8301565.1 Kinase, NEK [Giardia intestinalis]